MHAWLMGTCNVRRIKPAYIKQIFHFHLKNAAHLTVHKYFITTATVNWLTTVSSNGKTCFQSNINKRPCHVLYIASPVLMQFVHTGRPQLNCTHSENSTPHYPKHNFRVIWVAWAAFLALLITHRFSCFDLTAVMSAFITNRITN